MTPRHLASLYSPPRPRRVLEVLCAIEAEVYASLRPGLDHHVAHTRLQWWREECVRTAEGRPVHPLTRELTDAYSAGGLATPARLGGVIGFVDTAVWDLAAATFETRRELAAYCERWAAATIEIAALSVSKPAVAPVSESAAAPSPESPAWRTIGVAIREIELLAELAREAQLGRIRLPLDELERAGSAPEALHQTPWSPGVAELLRVRYGELRSSLSTAVRVIQPEEQPETRGLLVWASHAWRVSLRAERALPGTVVDRPSTALVEVWQSWRAARRAMRGRFAL